MKKELMNYVAPSIEVIKMEVETVLATSGADLGNGGVTEPKSFGSNRSGASNSCATSSEIEDMLNDILTVEN